MQRNTLLFLLLTTATLSAQWTQRADLLGPARTNAVGFSIGAKGYIATGFDGNTWLNDCWEYDPAMNSWTQKTSMSDNGREGAVAFTIGNKAYVGTGKRDTVFKNDLLEFDPVLNTWVSRANFPGTARSEASAFSIGTRGYVGLGYDGMNRNDFFEWNQGTNTWIPRASFPPNARNSALGFSLSNGRGYFGGGYASGNVYQDIFEYNVSTNQWLFSGMTNYQAYAMAVSTIGAYAFYGTGIDDNSVYYNNFTEWDPSNGALGLAAFSGTPRYNAVSFSVGNSIFLGTGYDSWVTQDLWEYTTTLSNGNGSFSDNIRLYHHSGILSVNFNSFTANASLYIYDVTGKQVFSSAIRYPLSELDLSSLSSGVYFAHVSTPSVSIIRKFIK